MVKAVILAGGYGTRFSEETMNKPKPMIEIGDKPIIWHVMKIYAACGVNEFIICCGYKGYLIKEYFANYSIHHSDVTYDLANHSFHVHHNQAEDWKVTVVDTGLDSMTGGRLKRIAKYVQNERHFFFTYGDGVSDVNPMETLAFHQQQDVLATLVAPYPPGRFGVLSLDGTKVQSFKEKPRGDGGRINGGFFVLSPGVFDFIDNDKTVWEQEPLETLANKGQLAAFKHDNFWHPMDTLRDQMYLNQLWSSGQAPWKVWS